MRCLERDRDERYSTMRELARDLHRHAVSAGELGGMPDLSSVLREVCAVEYAAKKEQLDNARQRANVYTLSQVPSAWDTLVTHSGSWSDSAQRETEISLVWTPEPQMVQSARASALSTADHRAPKPKQLGGQRHRPGKASRALVAIVAGAVLIAVLGLSRSFSQDDASPLDAQVSIASLSVVGPLPRSEIQQAVTRHVGRFRACYRSAAGAANRNAAGAVDVSIYIDSSNTVQKAKATGEPLPGIAACVQKAASATAIRPRTAPDVGGVHIEFQVKFKPLKK
jgi:hypothetical protein